MIYVRQNLIEDYLLNMWRSSMSHVRLVDHSLLAEQFIVSGVTACQFSKSDGLGDSEFMPRLPTVRVGFRLDV